MDNHYLMKSESFITFNSYEKKLSTSNSFTEVQNSQVTSGQHINITIVHKVGFSNGVSVEHKFNKTKQRLEL